MTESHKEEVTGPVIAALIANASYAALSPGGVHLEVVPENKSPAWTTLTGYRESSEFNSENKRFHVTAYFVFNFVSADIPTITDAMNLAQQIIQFNKDGTMPRGIRGRESGERNIRPTRHKNSGNQTIHYGTVTYEIWKTRTGKE